jgi:PAS domain S-box-containing protein
MTEDIVEFRHRRSINGKGEEWCRASFSVSEREDGKPKTAILTIRSIESFMREQEEKSRERMAESLAGMSDGFFIYNATGNEKIQFVNPPVLEMFGCKNIEEFREFTGNSFKGMVHPDDYKRISSEISEQIKHSDNKMDYIHYRIVRKDGTVRWIDDCGHLEVSTVGEGSKLFYVFIRDITDEMTAQQKSRLLALNEHYNIQD